LQDKCRKESQQIDDQQVLGDGGYTEHHIIYDFTINDLLFILPNGHSWAQNYEKYLFYASIWVRIQ
jgi:hypothetical protein